MSEKNTQRERLVFFSMKFQIIYFNLVVNQIRKTIGNCID